VNSHRHQCQSDGRNLQFYPHRNPEPLPAEVSANIKLHKIFVVKQLHSARPTDGLGRMRAMIFSHSSCFSSETCTYVEDVVGSMVRYDYEVESTLTDRNLQSTIVEKRVFEKRENDGINSSEICLTGWMCFPTVKKRSGEATATSGELIPSFYRT
jgi:hypothetical protein